MKTTSSTPDFIQNRNGRYRFIAKCRAGFMSCSEARPFDNEHYQKCPESLMTAYKPGSLQTIEFQPEGTDHWLTVFARKGKKICVIDRTILESLTVGTINTYWLNTELYDQAAYSRNGARTWADKAYVKNQPQAAEKAA